MARRTKEGLFYGDGGKRKKKEKSVLTSPTRKRQHLRAARGVSQQSCKMGIRERPVTMAQFREVMFRSRQQPQACSGNVQIHLSQVRNLRKFEEGRADPNLRRTKWQWGGMANARQVSTAPALRAAADLLG